MTIQMPFDQAKKESDVLWESWCMAFRKGAQECREMLARFVENSGDKITAASIRHNWNPSWGRDPGQLAELNDTIMEAPAIAAESDHG